MKIIATLLSVSAITFAAAAHEGPRKVELSVQDREYSYLSSGIAKGERVVVNGALLLQSELSGS